MAGMSTDFEPVGVEIGTRPRCGRRSTSAETPLSSPPRARDWLRFAAKQSPRVAGEPSSAGVRSASSAQSARPTGRRNWLRFAAGTGPVGSLDHLDEAGRRERVVAGLLDAVGGGRDRGEAADPVAQHGQVGLVRSATLRSMTGRGLEAVAAAVEHPGQDGGAGRRMKDSSTSFCAAPEAEPGAESGVELGGVLVGEDDQGLGGHRCVIALRAGPGPCLLRRAGPVLSAAFLRLASRRACRWWACTGCSLSRDCCLNNLNRFPPIYAISGDVSLENPDIFLLAGYCIDSADLEHEGERLRRPAAPGIVRQAVLSLYSGRRFSRPDEGIESKTPPRVQGEGRRHLLSSNLKQGKADSLLHVIGENVTARPMRSFFVRPIRARFDNRSAAHRKSTQMHRTSGGEDGDMYAEPERQADMPIYIDADACPVKEEVYRVARRYGIKVFVVANSPIRVPPEDLIELVVVQGGFDAADDWIAERIGPATSRSPPTSRWPTAACARGAGARPEGARVHRGRDRRRPGDPRPARHAPPVGRVRRRARPVRQGGPLAVPREARREVHAASAMTRK